MYMKETLVPTLALGFFLLRIILRYSHNISVKGDML